MPSRRAIRYEVIATGLNLRESGDLDAPVIRLLTKGERLSHVGNSTDGKWLKVRHRQRIGWVAAKYVQAVPANGARAKYPWLDIARGELGVQELASAAANPRIVEYLRSTTLDGGAAFTDETPWCSAFANWCVERAGHAGTDSAWARSWLTWGKPTTFPSVGCIVVLQRDANKGHVGFFVSRTPTRVRLLGGNQQNRVCEADYPLAHLLGYRAPA